jgi:hypothetical protein
MDVGSSSVTIGKGHLPWSDFMVHSVKRPLEKRAKESKKNMLAQMRCESQ